MSGWTRGAVAAALAVLAAVVVVAVVVRSVAPGPAAGVRVRARAVPAVSAPEPGVRPLRRVGRTDCRVARCVALTFDDGPSALTGAFLDELEAERATATFFLIGGHVAERPGVVRREFRHGFAIGDHTAHHPDLTRLPPARVRAEVALGARQIARVTGVRPRMLRPPFGRQDATVRAAARMPVIEYDVTSLDWRRHGAAAIERRVLARVRPGSIVLLHDRYRGTLIAVPRIVAALRARGYTLVTVPQLLATTGMRAGAVYFRGP
ncbi:MULTISPECIES: polysaccharide deacetylase family protein [Streptomycetaceae]|nr:MULTISPECIES: polysaccharide deacetylase family protein [Streptomycetaceae]MYS57412.1 polysaccharide deacetylase family protein [Streptomyces sp. SID5468]CCB72989.1 Predicted xylanase/chitin deacetylase [Streptantibioticus cattleyicolor NRRL 8057 = DSM 46488]